MDESAWVELDLPPEQLKVPPDLHAVPASVLPTLEPGKIVTWGEPDQWWLVDAGFVMSEPTEGLYPVRLFGGGGPIRIPTDRLWVYQPAMRWNEDGTTVVASRQVQDLEPWEPHSWMWRLRDEQPTPPPVRRPRPARELPSLSGRQLRTLRTFGAERARWEWVWAVSEPLNGAAGEAVIRVVDADAWIKVLGGEGLTAEELSSVPLTCLWCY